MSQLELYIAIEGPIGVGKTSLAKMIADKLNARKVFEDFKGNPFLEDFSNFFWSSTKRFFRS